MARTSYLLGAAGLSAVLLFAGTVSANVFIEENFEDGVAWDGSGAGTVPTGGAVNHFNDNADFNTIDDGSVPAGMTITPVGTPAIAAGGSPFSPTNAYAMAAGDSIISNSGFTGNGGGPLQYVQFYVQAASASGLGVIIASFDWSWDTGASVFYVDVVSDGAGGATIEVGERSGANTVIGALANAADWELVTVGINKNFAGAGGADETDPRFGGFVFPEGTVQFWSDDTLGAPGHSIALGAGLTSTDSIAVTVAADSIALDDFYYEGALTPGAFVDNTANAGLRNPDPLVPVELSAFGLE